MQLHLIRKMSYVKEIYWERKGKNCCVTCGIDLKNNSIDNKTIKCDNCRVSGIVANRLQNVKVSKKTTARFLSRQSISNYEMDNFMLEGDINE